MKKLLRNMDWDAFWKQIQFFMLTCLIVGVIIWLVVVLIGLPIINANQFAKEVEEMPGVYYVSGFTGQNYFYVSQGWECNDDETYSQDGMKITCYNHKTGEIKMRIATHFSFDPGIGVD